MSFGDTYALVADRRGQQRRWLRRNFGRGGIRGHAPQHLGCRRFGQEEGSMKLRNVTRYLVEEMGFDVRWSVVLPAAFAAFVLLFMLWLGEALSYAVSGIR